MLKVEKLKANQDFEHGKFEFLSGKEYYSRKSKSGRMVLIKDENGRWYEEADISFAVYLRQLAMINAMFTVVESIVVNNYEEAKQITG